LHALTDALLACLGQGDIGLLFPDSDPELDNIDSGILLSEVMDRVNAANIRLTHVDLTVIAQIPRLTPWRESIRKNVASLLHLPLEFVNVKATTEEGLGFTGEKKA
jgi:2-C-methyl-D-erythritol 4-phosphate cytidylyltransferase (EC 2.7.7.60)/2-C-methyl-D-erythritol 2,4-cyclodiphosphate synthase (EC 4.6.1.12)